jgi:hypothetical protein
MENPFLCQSMFEKALHLANIIGHQVAQMPFTYLGLPLGTTRPSMEDFQPLLHRV